MGRLQTARYALGVEDVLSQLGEQPLLLLLSVFVLGGILFFILRNLLRLVLVMALGLSAVAGLYYFAEAEHPEVVENFGKDTKKALKEGMEQALEASERFGEKIGSEVKKAARTQLEKLQ